MSFADISSPNPIKQFFQPRTTVFSWEVLALKLLVLALMALMLEKPNGSLSGRVALEEKGFNLSTYNLRDNHVYAIVNGPRGGVPLERGVWVKSDGTFELDQLPVGEYTLRVRAPGFSTELVNGIFVQEGAVNKLPKPVGLALLEPTVNIAAESRVFTSKEPPHFWINATGASRATVKVYKKDLFSVMDPVACKKYGLNFSVDFGMFVDSSKNFADPFKGLAPVKTFNRKLEQDATDDAHAEFKFDSTLEPGEYFAVAEVLDPFGKNSARTVTWFSVSDIGLVVKYSPDKAVIRAVDLNTLKAVSGVQIKFFDKSDAGAFGSKALALTGIDGLATIAITADMHAQLTNNLVVTGELAKNRAYGGFSVYQADNDTHKTYFYTDRPVYRLGQTVCFKGISRLVDGNGLANIGEGKTLKVAVEDPDHNEIQKFELKTNKHGTFHGLINIPETAKTGGCQVQITYPDGHTDYSSFEIAEYRKPEYQVEVKALSDRVVEGDKAKFQVKASYYFGGPVANARVKYRVYSSTDFANRWRLMSRPSYFNFFDDWASDGADYGGTGDFVAEGFCVTDANGEAAVDVQTTIPAQPENSPAGQEFSDKKLKVEAEVTDISRLSVVSSGSVSMTPGNFFVSAEPTNYVITTDQSVGLDLTATDYAGKVVPSASLSVKMMRYPYDRLRNEYKPVVVLSQTNAVTDAAGKAHLDIAVGGQMPSDSYYLEVTGKDKEGHLIGDEASVWVSNSSKPFSLSLRDTKAEPLTVKLDKKVYKPGDTAKVIIAGPFNGQSGMDAMVSVEGRKLHDLKIVPLTSSAQLIEIPVKPEYAPNFYVNVLIVGQKRQFYMTEEMVQVSPASHFLKLAVATDKARYKPGETVNYTISARDAADKPVKDVELSLGVVDESIYAIRAETAADITKFFYDRVPNWVTTCCSFPEQYSGGPDKMEPRVRKDFRDTAAWVPELTTDDKGEAHAAIKLPDNLTTWRATVRGINMGTEVGAITNKIVATQDIIARLALPRFFSTGDQGLVTAVVHNYSGMSQKIKLALTITDKNGSNTAALKLGQSPATTLDLAADAAGRVSYPVTAMSAGKVNIKLVATCPTGGDAVEKELYVKPIGLPVTLISSGCLTKNDDQASLELTMPQYIKKGDTVKRTLALATSSIGPVLGNFAALIGYPYGCTEQTMSRLVPSTVAIQLNKKLGVPLSKQDMDKFAKVYQKSLEKLTGYQHADGGWGWWANDDTNPYLTALVMEGFKNLSHAGFVVPPAMTQGGIKWMISAMGRLTSQLSDPNHVKDPYIDSERTTDLSYMLFARSLWPQIPEPVTLAKAAPTATVTATTPAGAKKATAAVKRIAKALSGDASAETYLLSKRDSLEPEALAYLARALKLRGRDLQAQACIARLIAVANTTDTTIDWDRTAAMSTKLGIAERDFYCYRFTPEESTALAMQAIVEVSPTTANQDQNANLSENQAVIEKAKAWLFLQRGKDGWGSTKTTAAVFKALLADELNLNSNNQSGLIAGASVSIDVNMAGQLLKQLSLAAGGYAPETTVNLPGSGTLSLKKQGAGRLYYSATTNYYQNLDGENAKLSVANLPTDLKIDRKFYHLVSAASTSDGVIHVKSVPIEGGKIKAGETVLMKVIVTSPRRLPYVIVQADLPSGAEVVESQNEATAADAGNDDKNSISGDWTVRWWTHQDILDDKIVFFGTQLQSGKSEFTTLLRMELPGTINVDPVMVEGMYAKGVKGFSTPLTDKLQISE